WALVLGALLSSGVARQVDQVVVACEVNPIAVRSQHVACAIGAVPLAGVASQGAAAIAATGWGGSAGHWSGSLGRRLGEKGRRLFSVRRVAQRASRGSVGSWRHWRRIDSQPAKPITNPANTQAKQTASR